MSILDKELFMSDAQAITTTADSDVKDLGKAGDPVAHPMYWVVRVKDAFGQASGTPSLTVALQVSDASDSGFAVIPGCGSVAATQSAGLTAGTTLIKIPLPPGLKRYIKTVFTCSAAFNAGSIDSYLAREPEIV